MTTMTEQTTQVYSVFIRATPEQVWDAITKPEFTTRYFYGSRIDSTFEPGAPLPEPRRRRRARSSSTARSSSPTRRACSGTRGARCTTPRRPARSRSRVTWEIEPQEGGVTKLTVVHDQLEAAPKTAASVAGGWSYVLSGLKTLLETGEPLESA